MRGSVARDRDNVLSTFCDMESEFEGHMSHPLADDLNHVLAHTAGLWENLRGESVFVTGGTGFVGTWLMESLVWAEQRLNLGLNIVLLTRNPDAFRSKAPNVANHPAVHLLRGDAVSFSLPEGKFPFVIHAATEPYPPATPNRPVSSFDSDVAGTRRVLEFARTHGTRRLLFTSSGAVYGKQPAELSQIPEDYPGAPDTMDTRTRYGQAKRVSEILCANYAEQYGFAAIIARLFAFVGPHLPLDANFAVGNFIRDVLRGGPVRVLGDGSACRSYLYAADMAIWLWTILLRGRSAYPYNVGSSFPISIAELARTVVNATAPETAVEIARRSDVPGGRYVPKTARAQEDLHLLPWISLEEGVRRTYAWGGNEFRAK
jgi:nucleoside-diphosphate-sugar epimerase